jgi:AraC-like DNA-binding protein
VADPGGRLTVSEIAYQVGFKNVSHFSRSFSRQFNMAPRDARRTAQEVPEPKGPLPVVETQEHMPRHRFTAHTLQASP